MPGVKPNVVVSMPAQNFTLARSFKANANGKAYIGKIDTDPTLKENQIQVYLEREDGSIVAVPQPIIINTGGYPVYSGQIAKFVTVEGHSMAIYDSYNVQQFYFPNVLKYDPDQFKDEIIGGDGSLVGIGDGKTLKDMIDGPSYLDFNVYSYNSNDKNKAFEDFIEKCNSESKEAIGNVSGIILSKPIKIQNAFNFDGVLTISNQGSISCIGSEYKVVVVNASELRKFATTIPSLSGFTGMIHIKTDSRLMKRYGVDEIVTYGEVNYIKNGKLKHPLNDDYHDKAGVEVRVVSAGGEFKKCKLSASVKNTTGHAILFKGCNFDAELELVDVVNPAQYSNFVRFEYCHSFSCSLIIHKSMGDRNANFQAYDSYLLACYDITLNQPRTLSVKNWKTLDGTNYRKLTVNGGNVAAIHSHWNGADIAINKTVSEQAFQFASHIANSSYDIDATVTDANTFLECRADYGFLAGRLNLKGRLEHNGLPSGAIYKHITELHTDINNSGVRFVMPYSVDADIELVNGNGDNEVSIIDSRYPLKSASYRPWTKLSAKVDYSNFAGNLLLKVALTPDYTHMYTTELNACKDNGKPIRLEIGNQDVSTLLQDNVDINFTSTGCRISCSSESTSARNIIFRQGKFSVVGGTMEGLFTTINKSGIPTGGIVTLENCWWSFKTAAEWSSSSLLAKFTTMNGATLDGSRITEAFAKGGFWVSASHSCKAINIDLANDYILYAPRLNAINTTVKKMAPINPRGSLDNFDKDFVSSKQ